MVVNLRPPLWMKTNRVGERDRPGRSVGRRARRIWVPSYRFASRLASEDTNGCGRDARARLLLHTRPGLLHTRILQEPLLAQIRLDGHVAALAVADVVDVLLRLHHQFL